MILAVWLIFALIWFFRLQRELDEDKIISSGMPTPARQEKGNTQTEQRAQVLRDIFARARFDTALGFERIEEVEVNGVRLDEMFTSEADRAISLTLFAKELEAVVNYAEALNKSGKTCWRVRRVSNAVNGEYSFVATIVCKL